MHKVCYFAADYLVQMAKMIFKEYKLPYKIMSDAGMNFKSKAFRQFCREMSIQQSITSSFHHQSNEQRGSVYKMHEMQQQKPIDNN